MLWSGLGPPCPQVGAGRECRACSQPCVASGPGSCRRTRPLTDAGSNVIFVCCSSWPGRPVSSLLQMLPDNDVRRLPAVLLVTFFFFFFFLRGGFLGRCATMERCWLAGWWPEHLGPCFSSSSCCHLALIHTSLTPYHLKQSPCIAPGLRFLKKSSAWGAVVSSLVVKSPSVALPPSPSVSWLQDAALLSQSIPWRGHGSCQLGCSCPTAARKPAQHGHGRAEEP